MKKNKKWPLLLYLAELLLLIAAIVFVIRLIPDFTKEPDYAVTQESAQENKAGEEPADEPTDEPTGDSREMSGESQERSESEDDNLDIGKTEPGRGTAITEESLPPETEAPYMPPVIAVASDLHYMSPTMTDFGEVLEQYTENSDGKVVPYIDQITDAFLAEIVEQKPSALILSGDISQDGEKVNHGELARKLRRVQSQGVPVLVIPGNHDINNTWAATYYGNQMVPTERVDANGFYDIYHEFGYDQAEDRDKDSLSYLYKLDERYWIMMLDSCIYEPKSEVGGRIKSGTMTWMEEWLLKAEEEQVTVIPVAHHNLLKESVLYPEDCTLKNSREVIDLLERFELPVYISGHLHLQRVKKNINSPSSTAAYGIHEIVSGSISIPPCQYGILNWSEDGSLSYHTKTVDVASWAKEKGSEDENLLNFAEYSSGFLVDIISRQAYRSIDSIPKERKSDMARLYGTLNSAYCAGTRINAAEVKASETYFYWKRYLGTSKWFDRLSAILKDTNNDHNRLELKSGVDFPAIDRNVIDKNENQE